MNVIKNKNSVAQVFDDGIFYIEYLHDTYSTLDDFKEGNDSFQTLRQGKKMKILFEMAPLASLDLEVDEYNEFINLSIIAQAIVVNSLAQRLMFSFYLELGNQKYPIKIFSNKNLALKWLKGI